VQISGDDEFSLGSQDVAQGEKVKRGPPRGTYALFRPIRADFGGPQDHGSTSDRQ
jgi:hypothetical protein